MFKRIWFSLKGESRKPLYQTTEYISMPAKEGRYHGEIVDFKIWCDSQGGVGIKARVFCPDLNRSFPQLLIHTNGIGSDFFAALELPYIVRIDVLLDKLRKKLQGRKVGFYLKHESSLVGTTFERITIDPDQLLMLLKK